MSFIPKETHIGQIVIEKDTKRVNVVFDIGSKASDAYFLITHYTHNNNISLQIFKKE